MTAQSRSEQEGILFFKLYLLAHHENYIEYMQQARSLAKWFTLRKEFIDVGRTSIICGNCYSVHGSNNGGGILHSCIKCNNQSNWGYELNQLVTVLNLPFHTCQYLLCKAVEDIYKYGTVEQSRHLTRTTGEQQT